MRRSILTPLQVNSAEPSKSKTAMQITYIPRFCNHSPNMDVLIKVSWVLLISDEIFLKCKQSVIFHIIVWPVSRLTEFRQSSVNHGDSCEEPVYILLFPRVHGNLWNKPENRSHYDGEDDWSYPYYIIIFKRFLDLTQPFVWLKVLFKYNKMQK